MEIKIDKEIDDFHETKIEDYENFCDIKHSSENSQKLSTEGTYSLGRKRDRENDEEEEKNPKNLNPEIIENNSVFLYSDDENDNALKDNSSSNSGNEYYDFNDFSKEQGIEDNDEKFDEIYGSLECNDEVYQQNNI